MEAHAADKQQVLAWEERWGKPVAYSAIGAVVLYLVGLFISLSGPLDRDNKATQLQSFHEHSSVLLLQSIMVALGFLLLIPVLYFLFRAVQARYPRVKPQLVGFVFLGPVLLAIQAILSWVATNSVSGDFVDQVGTLTGQPAIDLADKLIDDSTVFKTAAGLAIPGVLGIIIIVFYLSLVSMRAGLLSRFWGTFGMAFGIGYLVLGPVGVTIWALYVGLLAARWINPPPAWDAVEAIPWPAGGMKLRSGPDDAVETSGREVDGDGSGIEVADGDQADEPAALPSGEPPAAPPRKRKRRG
jgi:hypothetical protein